MKTEDQVCSLELAKCLKKFCVKDEDCLFWWVRPYNGKEWQVWYHEHLSTPEGITKDWEQYAAFTVAELWEMLPYTICDTRYWIQASKTITNSNRFSYVTDSHDFHSEYADTEADARAKMLIYLLENKLLKL